MSMEGPRIYVEHGDALESYSDTLFDSEDELQELLAKHTQLLSADDEPMRWLLITREAGVPDGVVAADRWSIDHLFVGQDGVPALVEVKRASDTRIRREVVGQLLDYAANGAKHWTADKLRQLAKDELGDEYEPKLLQHLGPGDDSPTETRIDAFWTSVEANLRNGRMCLIFAADRLPSELVTVIEFLDRVMPGIEVRGVQVQKYAFEGKRLLVTRTKGKVESIANSTRVLPSDPVVRDFLTRLRSRIDETLGPCREQYEVPKNLRKQLSYWRSYTDIGGASYVVHFGGYVREAWSPIYVGFRLETADQTTRDQWFARLNAITGSLPVGTHLAVPGKSVTALVEIPWTKPEELNDHLLLHIADLFEKFMTAVRPMLESDR